MMALLSSKEPFSYSNCSLLSTKLSVDRCINVEVPMRTGKFERRWLCLPSFIIAGAMKSGTGELMRWLNLHPFMQSGEGEGGRREVHFFGSTHLDQSPCPLLDYVRFFPVSDQKLANTKRSTTVPSTSKEVTGLSSESGSLFDANRTIQPLPFFTFDKSPSYIRDGRALAQIATTMPKAKLIVLLREPADRAYSEFRHHCLRARYRRLRIAATVLCSSTHLSNTQPWNRSRNRTISDEDRNSSPKPRATKGERASKGGKDSPVWRFEVGSIVRADIVQCRVFEGQADDALAQAPIESKEIMRLLEPVSRCSYADFAVYYFGPSQKRNFTRASGVARAAAESESEASSESTRTLLVNGWAWEEYSHGLYHMQIRRALRWYTCINSLDTSLLFSDERVMFVTGLPPHKYWFYHNRSY